MQKILALIVLTASGISSQAQVSASAERITLTKGDTWTYRTLDSWTDKELRQSQIEFATTDADNLVFRITNKATNVVTTYRTNLDLGACRTMQNTTEEVCKGPYKFPISQGQKTSYDKLPYPNGSGYSQADCSVVSTEKITVPAGSFDTFKIDCAGFWTNVFGSTANGNFKETIWYAPAVKRSVKSYYENRNSGNKISAKETTELLEYKVQ
jgi:hypothetical protein